VRGRESVLPFSRVAPAIAIRNGDAAFELWHRDHLQWEVGTAPRRLLTKPGRSAGDLLRVIDNGGVHSDVARLAGRERGRHLVLVRQRFLAVFDNLFCHAARRS